MPKSAAKGFVSAISDAMAFLVVDPASGAVKKLKASAALASTSVDGLMSGTDKSKLDGLRNPARAIFAKSGLSVSASTSYVVLSGATWDEELDTHGYFSQATNGRFTYGNATTRTFIVRVVGRVFRGGTVESVVLGVHKGGTALTADSATARTETFSTGWAAIGVTTSVSLANGDILDVRVSSDSVGGTIGAQMIVEFEEVVS